VSNTGFSIVTPNRDRLSTLQRVIGSWQACRHVSEIIIVDFGSREPIAPGHFASTDKLHIVRVENADCWRIGLAINIGVQLASGERICKLDSDIAIRDDALLSRVDLEGAFYRGRDGTATSNGQACFRKRSWEAVGGYNEWMSGYGFDDTDFYQRLRQSGLTERSFEDGSLEEMPHDPHTRATTDYRSEVISIKLPDPGTRMTFMVSRNTYLAMLRQWSSALRLPFYAGHRTNGVTSITLSDWGDEYRWADTMASYLAVVRLSGTPQNVELLNSLVLRYLNERGGF
jgi:glycosyltransferase involved in cell wall biosynthesis